MISGTLRRDESAAATELGYIFTFMLGVVLLTMFSIWAWDIETATRERWNDEALQDNLDRLASAVERADRASRSVENCSYAEAVHLTAFEASKASLTISLGEREIVLHDSTDVYDRSVQLSAAGLSTHQGEINLQGVDTIWAIHSDGVTKITTQHPSADT